MPPRTYASAAVLLFIGGAITFRVFFRRDYHRRGALCPLSIFLGWAIFTLWGFFTYADLDWRWPSSSNGPLLMAIAWSLVIVGLAGTAIAIGRLGIIRMHGITTKSLEQRGLYRWTRNPQVVGCMIAVIGYALFRPSWHTLGWVVLFGGLAHMMVVEEEAHLQRKFGEMYARYCVRVPRYFDLPGRNRESGP